MYSRSFSTFAINNPSITWNYLVRFAHGSHDGRGCVRQAPDDAIWMWNWAQLGTVVVVLA